MLYFLTPAMYPRLLMTLNEDLESVPVTVRVGQVRFTVSLAVFCSLCHRPSTSSVKPASHEQSRASRRIQRLFGLGRRSVQNSRPRSSSHIRTCWRTSSSSRRTQATRRKTKWTYNRSCSCNSLLLYTRSEFPSCVCSSYESIVPSNLSMLVNG